VLSLARRFRETTVTKRSWTPGRARHKRSNHRAGNVDVSASSAVTTLVCFLLLHTRLRVQLNTRHSLRPLLLRVGSCIARAQLRCGNAELCRHSGPAPHGASRNDEGASVDRSLAMTSVPRHCVTVSGFTSHRGRSGYPARDSRSEHGGRRKWPTPMQ
jgi:hypothetical protein